MSQFQKRYDPRAKRAVGLAQINDGMTARSALDALMRGELADSEGAIAPPAGGMPLSTAHDCARKIRDEREGRRGGLESQSPAVARAEMLRRLTVAADRLTKRLERRSRTGTADSQLADSLAKAARATRDVINAQRAAETSPPPVRGNGAQEAPAPDSPVPVAPLDALAAEIDSEDRAEARRRPAPSQH